MMKPPKGSHYVLLSNEEIKTLIEALGYDPEKQELKVDLQMVLKGTL